jgi:hypothetical protein
MTLISLQLISSAHILFLSAAGQKSLGPLPMQCCGSGSEKRILSFSGASLSFSRPGGASPLVFLGLVEPLPYFSRPGGSLSISFSMPGGASPLVFLGLVELLP